jgi:hypothetical protein
MWSTPEPPVLEPDAYTQQITVEPETGEYGVHTFGRDIAGHLARLLRTAVRPPVYRENRWDQPELPRASSYELTVDHHTVLITTFEVPGVLTSSTMPAWTIHLGGTRVPFEATSYRNVDWQLARNTWLAISHLQLAAQRAARDAAELAKNARNDRVTS